MNTLLVEAVKKNLSTEKEIDKALTIFSNQIYLNWEC